jgi:FAD/FMN-containing dehydrogenase
MSPLDKTLPPVTEFPTLSEMPFTYYCSCGRSLLWTSQLHSWRIHLKNLQAVSLTRRIDLLIGTQPFVTISGSTVSVDEAHIADFHRRFEGEIIGPNNDGYDETRAIWNAMIDKRPALIARCTSSEDVVTAVNFARNHQLLVSVRGSGHNVAGNAVCEGGLMIDMSLMKDISVDPDKCTATAQAGVVFGELDQATQPYGLAAPSGIVSETGIAGLTLGGGFGWLTRKHGFTCDNLLSAEVVTASGQLLTASDNEHQDLFWAIRGGGGNFGVVTSFTYKLHPLGPEVLAGLIL